MPENEESELSQLVSAVRKDARRSKDAHRDLSRSLAQLDDYLTEHATGLRVIEEEAEANVG